MDPFYNAIIRLAGLAAVLSIRCLDGGCGVS